MLAEEVPKCVLIARVLRAAGEQVENILAAKKRDFLRDESVQKPGHKHTRERERQ